MKDTFSKLHHDFSLNSSEAGSDKDSSEIEEKKKRREIGIKMLMSRESSFGVAGNKIDPNKSSKSLVDDSFTNELH